MARMHQLALWTYGAGGVLGVRVLRLGREVLHRQRAGGDFVAAKNADERNPA